MNRGFLYPFAVFTLLFALSSGLAVRHRPSIRVVYQTGKTTEEQLPECGPRAVCNKVDTYSKPWVEKQCRCKGATTCSTSLDPNDGHSIADKSRIFKTCESVSSLAVCRYFRDVTWTLTSHADNTTSQQVHCYCPKDSVAYIFKHEIHQTEKGIEYQYLFACSPESRLRCQRKEPCRLFTVKDRPDVEEVNTNLLCQCPRGQRCPIHHNDPHVIQGTAYPSDNIRTYSGYCNFDSRFFERKIAKYNLLLKTIQKLQEESANRNNDIDVLPSLSDYLKDFKQILGEVKETRMERKGASTNNEYIELSMKQLYS